MAHKAPFSGIGPLLMSTSVAYHNESISDFIYEIIQFLECSWNHEYFGPLAN